MPKDKRSGRSLKKKPYSEYDVIGYANNGTIKVLKAKPGVDHAGVPMFSNRKNTVYMIANDDNKVDTIGIYRNRTLVCNIDIKDTEKGYHFHLWRKIPEDKQKPKNKGKYQIEKYGHYYRLKPAYIKLINMAEDWDKRGS